MILLTKENITYYYNQVLTHLFFVLNVIQKQSHQREETKGLIVSINRINPRNSNGDTLLHLVVSKANTMKSNTFMEDPHTVIFPDPQVCELLLECDFNVDATNNTGSTPLHVACTRSNFNANVVKNLLIHGAHIDRRNSNGNQPHRLLASISECKINSLEFLSLKCLAARKIAEQQIPFVGQIPMSLEEFIRIH